MKRKQMKKSGIPRRDLKNEFVKIKKVNGARKISLKINYKTPPVIIEPSHWQVKTQGNEKDGFQTEVYFEEQKDEYLEWMYNKIKTNIFDFKLILELFPNIKEWTESAAMEFHARKFIQENNTSIIVVADGTTPRAGYLFGALYPKLKEIYSIDPLMKQIYVDDHKQMQSLKIIPLASTIETFLEKERLAFENLIVICPHSHVPLNSIVTPLFEKYINLTIITMECCFDQTLTKEEQTKFSIVKVFEEYDFNVHSEANNIKIWTSQ